MTERRTRKDYIPQSPPSQASACASSGCEEQGLYKAPVSPDRLDEYKWLCLDHIREHNQKWNFFDGMERDEIEHFMRDAVTGHRPTWERESHIRQRHEKLQQAFYAFMHQDDRKAHAQVAIPPRLRRAIRMMELSYPYSAKELKIAYYQLVKKYHPDANQGDKHCEEKFKEITGAYLSLSEHLKNA